MKYKELLTALIVQGCLKVLEDERREELLVLHLVLRHSLELRAHRRDGAVHRVRPRAHALQAGLVDRRGARDGLLRLQALHLPRVLLADLLALVLDDLHLRDVELLASLALQLARLLLRLVQDEAHHLADLFLPVLHGWPQREVLHKTPTSLEPK